MDIAVDLDDELLLFVAEIWVDPATLR